MEHVIKLDLWFESKLKTVNCSDIAKAYINSVLCKYKFADCDMSKKSLVITYFNAVQTNNFESFQNIGDWILYTGVIFPKHVDSYKQFAYYCASKSYYKCNSMLNGQWEVYNEIADQFPVIVHETRNAIVIK